MFFFPMMMLAFQLLYGITAAVIIRIYFYFRSKREINISPEDKNISEEVSS